MSFVRPCSIVSLVAACVVTLSLTLPHVWAEEAPASAEAKSDTVAKADDPLAEIPEAQRAEVARLLQLHNHYRAYAGRAPLKLNCKLCQAGTKFADYMARTGSFGHYADGRSPGDRIAAEGYAGATWAENIANSSGNADAAVSMWVNSSGHYANMLGGCTEVGFGHVGGMWVTVFSVPASK